MRASVLRDAPVSQWTWFLVALEDARDEIHDPVFGDAGQGIERSLGSIRPYKSSTRSPSNAPVSASFRYSARFSGRMTSGGTGSAAAVMFQSVAQAS